MLLKEFIDLVENGLSADGEENGIFARYNSGIRDITVPGTVHARTMGEVLAAGREQMKNPRYKKLVVGAEVGVVLAEVISQKQQGLVTESERNYFKDAIAALKNGEVGKARELLIGEEKSLFMALAGRVPGGVAKAFYDQVNDIFKKYGKVD